MATRAWFQKLFGFRETRYSDVHDRFRIETDETTGEITLCTADTASAAGDDEPKRFFVGKFDTPSVSELRDMVALSPPAKDSQDRRQGLVFSHIVGDAGTLHREYPNSVHQAASQFNCLEMPGENTTPDAGITNYYADRTQGPACALACPAGTLYRNYFVGDGQHGQGGKDGTQLDLLQQVGRFLGNEDDDGNAKYWTMQNGYALPVGNDSFVELAAKMRSGELNVDDARDRLQVGLHWSTSVVDKTYSQTIHNVTQVYCSALPIGYFPRGVVEEDLEPLARLCLDGLYEATLAAAAVVAQKRNERVRVFLTMVGGGVFRNDKEWIISAIQRAWNIYKDHPLDVTLVHYKWLDPYYTLGLPEIICD